MNIVDGNCVDVIDGFYILETQDGVTYQIPVGGTIPMEDGQLIAIDENKYLRINFDEDINETVESEHVENEHADSENKCHAEWGDNATKLLIDLYRMKKELVENRKIKTMKRMWESLQEELNGCGYRYTAKQWESKWKSLERAYKNKLENNKKTGREKRSCPYERELGEILIKKASVFPPCLMDNGPPLCKPQQLQESGIVAVQDLASTCFSRLNTPESDSESTVTPPVTIPSKRPQCRNNLNNEIKELRQALEKRTNMKKKAEERKAEQRDALIVQMRRRNDLLEKLLERSTT